MKIKNIKIKNKGYVYCHSNFYFAQDILQDFSNFSFSIGVNKLEGEIDSGIWAISYLMSMYNISQKDFILFDKAVIEINDKVIPLNEFCQYSCYMDKIYPLFNTKRTVRKLVEIGLEKSKSDYTPEQIRDLFNMDSERFERPISAVGNEVFKAMAAIGYANNKQVFCFPWMSKMRYNGYHNNIKDLLTILSKLEVIVIFPRQG